MMESAVERTDQDGRRLTRVSTGELYLITVYRRSVLVKSGGM